MLFLRAVICVILLGGGVLRAQESTKCFTGGAPSNPKAPRPLFSLPTEFRDSLSSPSGRFMLHYDATNSISDSVTTIEYIRRAAEECDSAYNFEIGELGYTAPAFTNGSHYDFYVTPLHLLQDHPYGATYWLDSDALPDAPSGTKRRRSYCKIENSFADPAYHTHGYDALRVTIFHEFFHMTQFSGYGVPMPPFANYTFFQEMSSAWMEMRSTPEVKDYLQYAKHYLSNLELSFDHMPGLGIYGEYLFLAYLSNRYGDNIIRECWQNYRDSTTDPISAIDLALHKHGTSWCQEYEKFGTELMQIGTRFTGVSELPDAPRLPLDALVIHKLAVDSNWHFITYALSLTFAESGVGNDTCDAVLARDTNRLLPGDGSLTFLGSGRDSVSVAEPLAYCDTIICTLPAITGIDVFPNPFVLAAGDQDSAFIQAASNAKSPVSTILDIYSMRGTHVRHYDMEANAVPVRGTWNATWNGRDDLGKPVPGGEYLLKLRVDGALKVGKIVLVRE